MTQPRSVKVSKLWRQKLCDPNGNITDDGKLMLSDLAKYCGVVNGPTRRDKNDQVDPMATMEAVGMQKLYNRICMLLALPDQTANKVAIMPWPEDEELI